MSDYRIIFRQAGGPEVLEREDIAVPVPAAGEVVVRHEAIGLNFIDTYHRSGLYPLSLPSGIGGEAAGTVEAVGPDVTALKVGDRVVYAGVTLGSYTTVRALPAAQLTKLPDAIDSRTAAAAFLKGLTADMLVGGCGKVQSGQVILVHAAAGGMGSLLVQWVHAVGATVIAHAGSAEKADKARALGADHVLSCPFDALAGEVRRLTNGRGVDTVFDGVGKASWEASLASLAKRGLLISYGNASGAVPPVAPLELMRAGSVFLTRPTMGDYFDTPADRLAGAKRLFEMIEQGKLKVEIGQTFPLAQAADAHRALESRATTGSTVLLP